MLPLVLARKSKSRVPSPVLERAVLAARRRGSLPLATKVTLALLGADRAPKVTFPDAVTSNSTSR